MKKIIIIDDDVKGRFFDKIRRTGECWEWVGSKNWQGRGKLTVDGSTVSAHRLSWMIHFGEIPPGLLVCHACDNPGCVNPSHLWLGTNADNMDDCRRKGRTTKGSSNRSSKLTEGDVLKIKRHLFDGKRQADIASEFGVTQAQISNISRGRAWGWLDDI